MTGVAEERGFFDATAGHPPALLGGSYMKGYRAGRRKIGRPMTVDADLYDKVCKERDELRAELERLKNPRKALPAPNANLGLLSLEESC